MVGGSQILAGCTLYRYLPTRLFTYRTTGKPFFICLGSPSTLIGASSRSRVPLVVALGTYIAVVALARKGLIEPLV